MLVVICLVCAVAALFYAYSVWNFNHWKNKGVVCVKPVPIVGAFPQAFLRRTNLIYEVNKVYNKYRDETPFVGYFAGRTPAVLLLDPKLIKDVFTSNFYRFRDNEFSNMINKIGDPIFRRNPFIAPGDEWKEIRDEIEPAFTITKLKTIFPILMDVCKKMNTFLAKASAKDNGSGLDAKEIGVKFAIDASMNCMYGIDSLAFTAEKSKIRDMAVSIFELSSKQLASFALTTLLPFLRNFWNVSFVQKNVEAFFTNLMDEAIKLRVNSKIDRDDYLNHVLELQKKKNFPLIDVASHGFEFFFDGFDPTSALIAHVLYQLAKNGAVQKRVRSEIKESIAKNGSITFDGLNEISYLDQVINETNRIAPPAAFTSKICTENTDFFDYKDKRVQIEKNTIVLIPIYHIQNDQKYYPNPQTFDPDRFSAANGGLKKYRDMGVHLAFGDGPRMCLGRRYAVLAVKAAVAEIVINNELTVNKKTQEPFVYDPKGFLLMPIGGISLNLKGI